MKKRKIIFFIYQLGAGGAARTMLNILNNIDRKRFTPILVTLDYEGDYERYLKPDITFVKLKTKRLRSAIIPLAKVIRKERPDIVFSTIPNYNTVAILARLLSFTKAKNVVREAAFLGGSTKQNTKLFLYGRLYRFASKVIALSNGVKDNIVKRYKINKNKIEVIYNPVDIENIQERIQTGTIKQEHQAIFQDDAKVIVTAGRLVRDKDHHTLLKAFAKLKEKMATKKTKLVILGEGILQEELKQLAKKEAIEEDVYFIGFQENPYIYFEKADLFVLSSLREGFGHVLAEALAVGTPVVSTKCKPGATEVLQNGQYGKLTPVGDAEKLATAMYNILSLEEKRIEEIINKGQERARDFDAKTIAKQYEKMFLRVLGNGPMKD
ncbi:glycosyltransferase involved in cell wall biosynthesis [Cerasibacillus quisquiliarum]|uniref:Glycosyl transferase n=1 Tax=Cerasibacillus quisquiliarum TaxID=227865 RepID=A0A511V0E8_9BACI|nr:glycosyltransferase [Cerasibacillus quisquiliarum]MBB5147472.1 glycosyltransferase involved in cell wall biosynthesis [Cerasibacillus quisquiliarum]GEN32387.1 glycosyl transferase [Cerasibacillus quisquiliarum]